MLFRSAGADLLKKTLERRAVQRGAGHALIVKVLIQADEVRMPIAEELTTQVALDLTGGQVALVADGLSRVDGAPQRPL